MKRFLIPKQHNEPPTKMFLENNNTDTCAHDTPVLVPNILCKSTTTRVQEKITYNISDLSEDLFNQFFLSFLAKLYQINLDIGSWSSMTTERLHNTEILSIERELSSTLINDPSIVIEEFAKAKHKRISFTLSIN